MNPKQDPWYQVLDRGDKPYLLLLHGVMSSRAQWLLNLAGLKAVVNPVVVELLAHGDSPSPADGACYTPSAYVAFFERLREDLGADDWYVCGQSFSAGLTMRYSLTHPRRVKGQIFTNSVSAFLPAPTPERAAQRLQSIAALRSQGAAALPGMPYFPQQGRLPDAVFQPMLADAYRIDPQGLALSWENTIEGLSVREDFHRTEVPTLLVNGTWEKAFQPVAELAGQMLPALQRADLPGGHSINAENPEGFNQAVAAFVRATR